jgi:hypothetical protein
MISTLVFGPIPFIAKPFDLVDVAREDMGDLAWLQLAFVVAKGADINRACGAAKKFG